MKRLLSDADLAQIWELAQEEVIAPDVTPTVDTNGDSFTIFGGWRDVETIAQIIYSTFPDLAKENAPTWEHLPADRRPAPEHHTEWAIGEYGFSGQFQTCSNCYVAIDTMDYQPDHVWLADLGELYCGDCLRKDKNLADDYLTYNACHLEEEGNCIYTRLAHPDDHGFVCLNGHSSDFCSGDYHDDHPEYKGTLTYCDSLELRRLAKAARLIDPAIQIVFNYVYTFCGSNVIWARFNPNENMEFPFYNNGDWDFNYAENALPGATDHVLGYALGRVFVKYESLRKGSK